MFTTGPHFGADATFVYRGGDFVHIGAEGGTRTRTVR